MDTVIIKICGPHKFRITNKSWFLPELNKRSFADLSPTEKQSTRLYLHAFRFDPPHQDAYLPKITIYETLNKDRDEVLYTLEAAFSVPKLLFGNSVQEVSENDFEKVVYAFRKALGNAGVEIESNSIVTARVYKLISVKMYSCRAIYGSQEVLAELKLTNISKAFDITEKELKPGVQTLHIYSQTVERVFYDKVIDALRPKGKRKDKGRMAREREIIDRYGLQNREIFRYEYRLKKNQTLKRDVNAALNRPYQTPVLFKDLFESSLCKTILLKSWHDLIQRPENQLLLPLVPQTKLDTLASHNERSAQTKYHEMHSMNRAFTSYGITRAILDNGAKDVRRAVFTSWNGDHSERFTNKMKTAALSPRACPDQTALLSWWQLLSSSSA